MTLTKVLCLTGSLLSAYAADDSKTTGVRFGSAPTEKVIEASFFEQLEVAKTFMGSLTADVDALKLGQSDVNQIYKLYQLIEYAHNYPKTIRQRFVADNIEFPRLFWGSDIGEFLKSKSPSAPQKGDNSYQKAFVRSDIHPSSTAITYAESRLSCIIEDVPVLEFLSTLPNVVAWCTHSEPNTVEGTNAKPKTTARYAFYEVPEYLSLILKRFYPVLNHRIDAIISSLQLSPLTYENIRSRTDLADVQAAIGAKKLKFQISGIFTQHTADSSAANEKLLNQLFNRSKKQFKSVTQGESQVDESMVASSSVAVAPSVKKEGSEGARRRRSSVTRKV